MSLVSESYLVDEVVGPREPTRVLLDMDDVLTAFQKRVCEIHGKPDLYMDPQSKGVYQTENLLNITADKFWYKIDNYPYFWEDLEKTDEADNIVDFVTQKFGEENIAILTAPSLSPNCVPGKRYWIARYFPQFLDRIIYAKSKDWLASPNRVLVDDRDRNCSSFVNAGGTSVLVPRPWNSAWRQSDVCWQVVRGELEEI